MIEFVSEYIVVDSDPELGWKAKKGRGYETGAVKHVSRALYHQELGRLLVVARFLNMGRLSLTTHGRSLL